MASIDYNDIYQSFYLKVEAYDFLEMDDNIVQELLCNWVHASARPPYIRRLFSSLSFDDDIMRLTYELKTTTNDTEDEDFVIELLALGLGINWLSPKVNSLVNLRSVYASKEEKVFSPAQTLNSYKSLLDSWKKEQRRMIGDRGYIYNAYVNGEDLTQ